MTVVNFVKCTIPVFLQHSSIFVKWIKWIPHSSSLVYGCSNLSSRHDYNATTPTHSSSMTEGNDDESNS